MFRSFRFMFVLCAVTICAPAFAQSNPVPPASVCFNADNTVCLRPVIGFTGTAYDFTTHSVIKSFTLSGLYELTIDPGKLGILAGAGFQTGDVQGLSLTQGVSIPWNLALTVNEMLAGTSTSVAVAIGTVIRF